MADYRWHFVISDFTYFRDDGSNVTFATELIKS